MIRTEYIKYITENDSSYDYTRVNFDFYSDQELQMMYEVLVKLKKDKEMEK